MENDKQIGLKLIFVLPGLLSVVSSVYSFIYFNDVISRVFCIHLM